MPFGNPQRVGGQITIRRNGVPLVIEGNVTVTPGAVQNASRAPASGGHVYTTTHVLGSVVFDGILRTQEIADLAAYEQGDTIEYQDNAGDSGVLVGAVLQEQPSKNMAEGTATLTFMGHIKTGDAG